MSHINCKLKKNKNSLKCSSKKRNQTMEAIIHNSNLSELNKFKKRINKEVTKHSKLDQELKRILR